MPGRPSTSGYLRVRSTDRRLPRTSLPLGHRPGVVSEVCPASNSYLICTHARVLSRCRAYPEDLEKEGPPRFRAHTEALVDTFDPGILWDVFGVNADVEVRPVGQLTNLTMLN